MFKESVEFNMQKVLKSLDLRPVSGSAFTQARYKIKAELFQTLFDMITDAYESGHKTLWKGYRLLAGDGSTLEMPSSKNIESYFGVQSVTKKGVKKCLARVFFLYDVMNEIVVRGKLATYSEGEIALMKQCLDTLPTDKSILILDRAFGDFCTIKELMVQERFFCIRLSSKNSGFGKRMITRADNEFVTDWFASPQENNNTKIYGLDNSPIKLRVVKIILKTGEIELLVTNLYNGQEITLQDLSELYHLRWGVEEGFKNLKPKMKIEQFGCKKVEGVFQEFYAHLFCMNLIGLTGGIANQKIRKKTENCRYQYKHNWKNAYRFVREKVISFLMLKRIKRWLNHLIEEISTSTIAIIPDRVFERDIVKGGRIRKITPYNK